MGHNESIEVTTPLAGSLSHVPHGDSFGILNVSDLIEEANQIINNGNAQVSVKVKGSFRTGSFPVDFSIHQSVLDLLNILNASGVTGALNLAELLGLVAVSGKGLFHILLWLKNRPIFLMTQKKCLYQFS